MQPWIYKYWKHIVRVTYFIFNWPFWVPDFFFSSSCSKNNTTNTMTTFQRNLRLFQMTQNNTKKQIFKSFVHFHVPLLIHKLRWNVLTLYRSIVFRAGGKERCGTVEKVSSICFSRLVNLWSLIYFILLFINYPDKTKENPSIPSKFIKPIFCISLIKLHWDLTHTHICLLHSRIQILFPQR